MTFKKKQYEHQLEILVKHPDWFCNDKGNGVFGKHRYPFVLQDGLNNLYKDLRSDDVADPMNVRQYFKKNGISWWNGEVPTNHLCSSQIACLNHLFPLRYEKEAVMAIANAVAGDVPFDDVLEVGGDDFLPGYISFEVVSSKDYLNEAKGGGLTRGSQCTSIDAVIIAKRKKEIVLLPIEWKFVEKYDREDKSQNDDETAHGDERIRRYFTSGLVEKSAQLKNVDDPHGSIYFQEPYYQLMRQTLWAEQVLEHDDTVVKGAEDYIHVHVVPKENINLLNRRYKADWDNRHGMVANWKAMLNNPEKYLCIDPKDLFAGLRSDKNLADRYSGLLQYLEARYW